MHPCVVLADLSATGTFLPAEVQAQPTIWVQAR